MAIYQLSDLQLCCSQPSKMTMTVKITQKVNELSIQKSLNYVKCSKMWKQQLVSYKIQVLSTFQAKYSGY